jgi:hypothetical protein
MTSLIDYFNDVATFQSEGLGIGIDYMKEKKYDLDFIQVGH